MYRQFRRLRLAACFGFCMSLALPNRRSFPQLYQKAPNWAGGDELLLDSFSQDRPDDWSPDGKFIVFEPNISVNALLGAAPVG